MPLMTTQVQRGVFVEATEPANWEDGDIWSDTTANVVKVNVGGTATEIQLDLAAAHTWSADQTYTDNTNLTLGTGGDADIDYDGTNVVINPKVVGSGVVSILGRIQNLEAGIGDGKLELIEFHEATGTESTFTFTTGFPHDMQLTYSKLIIDITLENTAALDLEMELDGLTATYFGGLLTQASTTLAGATVDNNTSEWTLMTSTLISGADFVVRGRIEISYNEASDFWIYTSHLGALQNNNIGTGYIGTVATESLASIILQTSTSTWKAGTKFILYGVKR